MSPGKKLAKLLKDRGLSKSDLGRRLNLKSPYDNVHKWTLDRGFSDRQQRQVEDVLKLREGYFGDELPEDAGEQGGGDPYSSRAEFFAITPMVEDERTHLLAQTYGWGDPGIEEWATRLEHYRSIKPAQPQKTPKKPRAR